MTDRLARVVSLSASTNAEYMTVGLMYHNDFWYFNSFGQEKQPIYRTPRSNALSRPPFPWAPYKEVPATGGAYFSVTERSFALKPTFQTAGDGSIYAKLMIGGLIPQNVMDETYSPPKLDFLASSSSTGGSFPGGKTFFIGISAKSASGSTYKLSKLSNVSRVAVPLGTNTNTITIHVPYWGHTAPPGFVVFVGESAETMTYQYEVDGQTPSTIVLNAAAVPTYNVKSWSAPDSEFNNFRFKVKKIRHAGVVGQEIVSVTSNSIKISMWTNHGFTVDQFAGHEVSVIGVKTLPDGSEVATPIADFPIVSNTADTLVVSGNPTTCVNGQSMKSGDVVVIRSRPTFGVDAIGSYVDDPDWVNALNYAEDGYTISSASNTTPIVATLAGVFPDWADGDTVIVQGVLGNTGANGCFAIASVNSAAKTLVLVGSVGTGESTSSGLIMRQIQGLIPDAERGNLIRFIKGTGRGTTVRIRSNTASRLYIDGAWPVTPDSSSRYIVEEPTWQFEKTTDAVNCDSPATEVWHELDVSNYRGEQLLVQAFTEDTGPTSSYDSLSPVREIFVFGRIGATSVSKVVYGNYTVTLYDEIILVDASSGPTTITLPGAVLVKGREYKVQKIDPTDNYVTIVGSDGDVINDQESAVLESQWQSVVLYAIGG